jgi:hypothetical protein
VGNPVSSFFRSLVPIALLVVAPLGCTVADDDDPGCEEPTATVCGTSCVDAAGDPLHCGGCGIICATGEECRDGSCASQTTLHAPDDFHGMVVGGSYQLRWVDTNVEEERYLLERRGADDTTFTVLAELAPDTTEFLDTGFAGAAGFVYRLAAAAEEQQGEPALCNSAHKLWTYIRIVDYDDLWGSEGPTMDELVTGHVTYGLELAAGDDNLDLVLLGDSYGNEGAIYAHAQKGGSDIIPQPELDMGSVATYRDFFDWVIAEHPGQRYVIDYWGHGGGVSLPSGTLGYDKTAGGGGLNSDQVAEMLGYLAEQSGARIGIFYLCTCLNQMFENAYAWRNAVEYVVAGETTVGCAYQPIDALAGNEAMSVAELAAATVAGFEGVASQGFDVVYSAVDTDYVAEAAAVLNELAQQLQAYASADPSHADQLRLVAGEAQSMENPTMQSYESAYLDLYDFCDHLVAATDDSAIQGSCAQLKTLLDGDLVIRMARTDAEGAYPQAHGLSIYHPNPRFPYYLTGTPEHYAGLSFARDTAWDEYITQLYPF